MSFHSLMRPEQQPSKQQSSESQQMSKQSSGSELDELNSSPPAPGKDMSSKIVASSSDFRKRFCEKVIKTSKEIFHREKLVSASKILKGFVQSLVDLLGGRESQESKHFPKAILVFDEASHIPNALHTAICRAFRELGQFSTWAFFLSTQSQVPIIAPAKQYHPSDRIIKEKLEQFEPFINLLTDVEICYSLAKE